jgi:hypothetical protein
MLGWLRKKLGDRGPNNGDAYPAETIELFAQELAPLDKAGADIPERALRYVIDGSDGDVLAAIAATVKASHGWMGSSTEESGRALRWQLYDRWDLLPADLWIRHGSLLVARSAVLGIQTRLRIARKHRWIEALALDLLGVGFAHHGASVPQVRPHQNASMGRLESLLEHAGEARSELVASTFAQAAAGLGGTPLFMRDMPGFGASVAAHAALLRPTFRGASLEQRIYYVMLFERLEPAELEPLAEELVELALDSSRQVRGLAAPIAVRLGRPSLDIARREAVDARPGRRGLALTLLWESGDAEQRAFVASRGQEDGAASVRDLVQRLQSSAQAQASVEAAPTSTTIPDAAADLTAALGEPARAALREMLEQLNDLVRRRKAMTSGETPLSGGWKVATADDLDTIVAEVAAPKSSGPIAVRFVNCYAQESAARRLLREWVSRDDVHPVHVVRLLISIGAIVAGDDHPLRPPSQFLLRAAGSKQPGPSLLQLSQMFEAFGVSTDCLLRDWFSRSDGGIAIGWPADAIWPFFARHLDYLGSALRSDSRDAEMWWFSRPRLFDALCTFPEVPHSLIPLLMETAFTGKKVDRRGAQRVLERLPGVEQHIISALSAGKAEARCAAAIWLARLRHMPAVPAIEKALAREKNDAAAGALMSALETLGVPVERFLDREGLGRVAARGLSKGVSDALSWFPFDGLPAVHWQDTGQLVERDIIRWFLVQSCKLKAPEPGGLLRRYCASMVAAEREALAVFVLRAWLAEDVRPVSPRAAEAAARVQAKQQHASIQQYPQYHDPSLVHLTEDQLFELYLPQFLDRPAGSAIASKGILAVVAACGGSEIAPMAQRYLKDYYGTRAAQGKALIQMLAWVEHPTATQLMLSIGSRFRTRGFQDEATRQAELLAERKGWSLDELADRTVPSAGLDENGESIIDYGTRQFTARLSSRFDIELYNADGKKIAALPDARRDEDEAAVAAIKKQLSSMKKELKAVVALQKDRLYEALCTQRRWRFEDWSLYLHRHPIVGRYCQQLVWLAQEEGRPPLGFRPLDDGTLTDLADEAVQPGEHSTIVLAHDSNVPAETAAAWAAHLEDYKVVPLFQQFGKGSFRLAGEANESLELEDFRGHVLEAFALRGRATKLGYTRGAAQDGGWFFSYDKRFPTLGLQASVEFTGNGLPEENRQVALMALRFTRRGPDSGGGDARVPLAEVPPVLLSECWNDMRLMAAEGTGFDPEWEKKMWS